MNRPHEEMSAVQKMHHDLPQEVGFIGDLFIASMKALTILAANCDSPETKLRIQEEKGRLALWGDGFDVYEGELDLLLEKSGHLKESAVVLLASIASTVAKYLDPASSDLIKFISSLVEKAERLVPETENYVYREDDSDDGSDIEFSDMVDEIKEFNSSLYDLVPFLEPGQIDTPNEPEVPDAQISLTSRISGFSSSTNLPNTRMEALYMSCQIGILCKFPRADLDLVKVMAKINSLRYKRIGRISSKEEDFQPARADLEELAMSEDYTTTNTTSFRAFSRDLSEISSAGPSTYEFPIKLGSGKPFTCPICLQTLKNIDNRDQWRKHVLKDLEPYSCTFTSCLTRMETFSTRKSWLAHEFENHRFTTEWICIKDCGKVFDQKDLFVAHVQNDHFSGELGPLATIELETMTSLCEQRRIPPHSSMIVCPFCGEELEETRIALNIHLGIHMEQIALTVLPRGIWGKETEEGGEGGEGEVGTQPWMGEVEEEERVGDEKVDMLAKIVMTQQRLTCVEMERAKKRVRGSGTGRPHGRMAGELTLVEMEKLLRRLPSLLSIPTIEAESPTSYHTPKRFSGIPTTTESSIQHGTNSPPVTTNHTDKVVTPAKSAESHHGDLLLGEDHPNTLAWMNNLAEMYRNQGKPEKAETLGVAVLEASKRVLGEDHPDTLISISNLAATYWNQGKFEKAETLGVAVLEASKRVLGEDHPDTLISMNNLAATYRNQGKLKKAEALGVAVLEARERVRGRDHPDTLTSMNNLAATYWNQGKFEKAETLGVAVLEASMGVLGEDHPNTLTSMNNLAATYQNQGKFEKAETLGLAVLEARERVRGRDHPDTLTSMNNLAATYWNQGKFEKAEALGVSVLEARERVLGEHHPNTLISISNLAATYWNQGKFKEAEALGVAVLEARKRVLGKVHPNTLTSIGNLEMYRNRGRFEEAGTFGVVAPEARKRVRGRDHPDTLTSMSNQYRNQENLE